MKRGSGLQRCGDFRDALDEVIVNGGINQEAGRCIADLSLVAKDSASGGLGGLFQIDLPDLDEAIRLASMIPAAKGEGAIEIRPVLQ